MLAGGLDLLDHAGRNGFAADVLAVVAIEVQGFFAEQIDDAFEIVFRPDGKLHQHGVAAELAAKLLNHLLGVAAGAVHLIDERQAGNAIAPHLAVDGQRLGLNPPTAQRTRMAPSSTRRLRSTSTVKSTWPGVSIRLMA